MHFFLQVRMLLTVLVPILLVVGLKATYGQQTQRTASDYGVSSETQLEWEDVDTEAWLDRLDAIELILQRESVHEDIRRQALRDISRISKAAMIRRQEEEARLKPIEKELSSLGPAPVEGEAPEAEQAANLRAEVEARLAQRRGRISELQLILTRTDNLELALITQGDSSGIDRLWVRSPILWDSHTWQIAADNWLTLLNSVYKAPATWWQTTTDTTQPTKFIIAISAGLIALFLGVPARRWLQRRVRRDEVEIEPTYGWRIYAAFITAIADMLLPSLALGTVGGAIWLLTDNDTLLPVLAIAVCKGGVVYFVLTGLARAVFAPQAPVWRVLPVTEEGAVVLNRRVHVVALYFAVADMLFNIAAFLGLLGSPEFATVTTLFLDGALALLLLTLLPSHYWHTEDEESTNKVVTGIAIMLGALLIAIPVLDLIGFSYLASYLLVALIVTVVAAGFTLLLRLAGHEVWIQLLHPASKLRLRLYRWFRLGEGGARILGTVGHLLIDSALFVALAYGLLRFYGLPNALLVHWVKAFADGIPIGSVILSPIDLIVATLVFAAMLLATGMVRRWLGEKLRSGTRLDLGIRNAIVAGVGYSGAVLAIILAIAIIGLDLSNLALVAGALSVGVGFGLRTVVENFVAGLLLLVERPIKEGDWIVTAGHHGTVKRISVRSTEIETFDRASVIVPNAELVAQPVENWTHKNRVARIIVPVGVAYGSDTEKVRDILLACAADHPHIHKYPEPIVLFQQFGESSLDFELRCFVKDTDYYLTAKSELHFAIDKAFREESIEIPFPQRDLHMHDGTPLQLVLTDQHNSSLTSETNSSGKVYEFPSRNGEEQPPENTKKSEKTDSSGKMRTGRDINVSDRDQDK
jgi:small-conductance mechanosensitive channel